MFGLIGFNVGVSISSAAVGVPVPPVVPSICTSRGRLNGGMPSSGVRLGDIGVGDLGDFGFIDTRRNAEGETSGPDVRVAGRLLGVELPYDRM